MAQAAGTGGWNRGMAQAAGTGGLNRGMAQVLFFRLITGHLELDAPNLDCRQRTRELA